MSERLEQDESRGTMDRRTFLALMGGSLALAGLSGCRRPLERVVPYVIQPEDTAPGEISLYATTLTLSGCGVGVLGKCYSGRPIKLEGNPAHPGSTGGLNAWLQAEILELYNPSRSQLVLHRGQSTSWPLLRQALQEQWQAKKPAGGRGARIVSGAVTSPTLLAQRDALRASFPELKWYVHEPVSRRNLLLGAQHAFNAALMPVYDFGSVACVVSLDSNFLFSEPGSLNYARGFMRRRRARANDLAEYPRFYAAEPHPTPTGSIADHRLAASPSAILRLTAALRTAVGGRPAAPVTGEEDDWLRKAAADLDAARGRGIVLAGLSQPPEVHSAVYEINSLLGNIDRTVFFTEPVEFLGDEPFHHLIEEMQRGEVGLLLVLGCNPIYTASADGFGEALTRVPFSAHLGRYVDETANGCTFHIPEQHPLETWGDARAFDGTLSVQQPLVAPLYEGTDAATLLNLLLTGNDESPHDIVQRTWQGIAGARNVAFQALWDRTLHDGVLEGSQAARQSRGAPASVDLPAVQDNDRERFELVLAPDPSVYDGRYAANPWLQELPRPFSTLVWTNVVSLARSDAERLGVHSGNLVEVRAGGQRIQGAVWIQFGQAPGTAVLTLGYGRTTGPEIMRDRGYNAFPFLKQRRVPLPRAALAKIGGTQRVITTQGHRSMDGRRLAQAVPLGALRAYAAAPIVDGAIVSATSRTPAQPNHIKAETALYAPNPEYPHAWGMIIDLNACIGCAACTAACQAENNIPVVGEDQVSHGREMHWIRIDYYDEPEGIHNMPVPCMHCEKAPCELVCPVGATLHSREGLNDMVYNRCVGTRYCSNNCPYKVRRFNFFGYADYEAPPVRKMLNNPNVTVRSRGVMEKCTYCVQRINGARIAAKEENRPLRDGEIVPACAEACPTEAIHFGNLADSRAHATRLRVEPHSYALLDGLQTLPRTTYLARVENKKTAEGDSG